MKVMTKKPPYLKLITSKMFSSVLLSDPAAVATRTVTRVRSLVSFLTRTVLVKG